MSDYTSLRLSRETRDALAEIGGKDDTFEEILKRLINEHNKELKK